MTTATTSSFGEKITGTVSIVRDCQTHIFLSRSVQYRFMPEIAGPRLLRSDEFDDLMSLLDRYFAYECGGMAARLPFVYDRQRPKRHAVITVDDQIVSHAACVPETLRIGTGVTVECCGIGGVATAKPHRGNGYMSRLLEFWLERMADDGVPLAELSGNRERYGHFGWERAGREITYSITARSAPDVPIEGEVRAYDGTSSDLNTLLSLHRQDPLRVERDRERAQVIYGQRGLETFVYAESDADTRAYVSLSNESRDWTIREFGGDSKGLQVLVSYLFNWYDLNTLTVYAHPTHPHNKLFHEISSSWRTQPPRLLNILDFSALLTSYAEPLKRRWKQSELAGKGTLTLGVEGSQTAVRLAYDSDDLAIETVEDNPDLSMNRRAATRLLFGAGGCHELPSSEYSVLDVLLPLEYYVWRTEYV